MNLYKCRERGYILLPVVLLISLVAAVAAMLNSESGMEGNITAGAGDVAEAHYVAEAGLNHAQAQVAAAGCTTYTDMTAEPFGNHSYSTTITTNNVGGTLTTVTVPVIDDAFVRKNAGTQNNGTAAELEVYFKWFDTLDTVSLYKYDIASAGLAPGTTIVSAVMKVFVLQGDPTQPVKAYRITADWDEASVTWDSWGLAFDSTVLDSIPTNPPTGQYVDVNITSLVQGWVNGSIDNQGVMLGASIFSNDNLSKYTSKEYGNTSQRPYLEITVSDGSLSNRATIQSTGMLANGTRHTLTSADITLYQQPPVSLTIQPGADDGKDAWITSTQTSWNYGSHAEISVNSSSQRGLIGFGLDGLPPGVRIDSAVLSLYRNNTTGAGTLSVYPVAADWVEGTCSGPGCSADGATWDTSDGSVSWSTPGGDYIDTALDSQPIDAATGWYNLDVTAAVSGWAAGTTGNNGLLLVGSDGLSARFSSSDYLDATQRPYLTVTFSCTCGVTCQVPQGSGNLLLVVGDEVTLVPGDELKRDLFETWGYTVSLIDDDSDQATFDTELAANDVAYISETANGATLGSKLAATDKGVVNEEYYQNSFLGLSSSGANAVGDSLAVIDNSHYITALFPGGVLPIYEAPMEATLVTGTPAPSLQTLGDFTGISSLALVDNGGTLEGGGTAAGRRVTIPVGHNDKFNWDYLNNNGRLIVQRAIQWGTGNTGGFCTAGNYRDEFGSNAFNINDGSLSWAGDWIELDGSGSGPSSGRVIVTGGELRLNGTPLSLTDPSLAREMDLSSHLSATLTFDYRTGSGVEPGEDSVVVEVSGNGGASWTVLEDFINEPASASGSRSYDISGYLGANTQVRFRINANYGGASEYFFVDNLEVAAGCTSPPPPAGDKLLLVVVNPGSLTTQEDAKKILIESWGYTVSLIDESDSQANYDTAIAANDVVYITEDVSSGNVGTKLVNATIGVVTEEANLSDEFGLSDSIHWGSGTQIKHEGNHYITETLTPGTIPILTATESLADVTGALAPDILLIGQAADGPAIVAVEAGANVIAGRTAAGRRVQLPWGGNNFDLNHLNADGTKILKRAIEWGAGAGGGGGGSGPVPIAHWKLDDATGTVAVDSAGGHDGGLVNGPTWTAGQDGGALDLDGANDTVRVAHAATLSLTDTLTVSAWINPDNISATYRTVLAKDGGGSGSNYFFGTWQDEIVFGFFAGGTFREVFTTGLGIQAGSWQHIAATFDNAADEVRLYLDGALVHTGTLTFAPTVVTADLSIGRSPDGEYWRGLLDDIRIYDSVLTEAEIATIHTSTGGGGGGGGGGGPSNFGFETIFPSSQSNVRRMQIATRVTLPEDGTVTSITAYVGGDNDDVRYAIYTDVAGEPGVLLAETANAVSASAMDWLTIDLPDTLLTAGTYWLALSFNDRNQKYHYESGGQTRYNNNRATRNGYTASWGASTASHARNISIYATYTP